MNVVRAANDDALYDDIIIGAGHNGLICAWRLAESGRRVLVVEAAARIGGACATHEFAPGYRVSSCAHLLLGLSRGLRRDLRGHGLRMANPSMASVALARERPPVVYRGTTVLGGLSDAEQRRTQQLLVRMQRHAAALAAEFSALPLRPGLASWEERAGLLGLLWRLRRVGRPALRDLLRIGAMSVYDLLQDECADELLQGALGFDAVLGSNYGPRSPGTVLTWLHRLATCSAEPIALPVGGMGAVTDALASAAQRAGVEIRTGATVRRILVGADRASGVELETGEQFGARCVVSSADPRSTLLNLLGHAQLNTGFVRALRQVRGAGLAAKLHLALRGRPRFIGVDATGLGQRLLHSPSLDQLERAFNASKYGEFSPAPALEITVPSQTDPTLAPEGCHVLSAIVQYVPGLTGARSASCLEVVLRLLEQLAPGIQSQIVAAELLTPADLALRDGSPGGHWHQVELALDQFHLLRPMPGLAQYSTPLAGLYLCGAGSHPGGGVTGHAGENAARRVLRMERG